MSGITSYAQNFEDVILWRALGHVERGLYIDVGAQDPVKDSVSLAFHERSWKGIHVEPTAHYAELLRQQRKGDIVLQAAIAEQNGLIKFFEIPNTGISTAAPEIALRHRSNGFEVAEIWVPSVTLESVFDMCPGEEIHWLKVDVEGSELQVLKSWGESEVRPWIVVVESTLPLTTTENYDLWEHQLLERGYSFASFDGLNRFYVSEFHSELRASICVPPNVFDEFKLTPHSFSSQHHLIIEAYERKVQAILENRQSADNTEVTLGLREDVGASEFSALADLLLTDLAALKEEVKAARDQMEGQKANEQGGRLELSSTQAETKQNSQEISKIWERFVVHEEAGRVRDEKVEQLCHQQYSATVTLDTHESELETFRAANGATEALVQALSSDIDALSVKIHELEAAIPRLEMHFDQRLASKQNEQDGNIEEVARKVEAIGGSVKGLVDQLNRRKTWLTRNFVVTNG